MNARSGFTAVELVIAGGISTMVLVSSMTLMLSVARVGQRSSDQTLVDQLYYQGVAVAQTPRIFVDRIPAHPNPLGLTADQLGCLAGKPPASGNCSVFDDKPGTAVPDVVEANLNHAFSQDGPCTPGQAGCIADRSVSWSLVCKSTTACTGIRVHLTAEARFNVDGTARSPASAPDGKAGSIRTREGDIFVPASQFVSKAGVDFHCHRITKTMTAIDYQKHVDLCVDYPGGSCPGAMDLFGPSAHCIPPQNTACTDGVGQIGFFETQRRCVAASTICDNGGTKKDDKCVFANRWCWLASATGPILGFKDDGSVDVAGCRDDRQILRPPESVVRVAGNWAKCKSGPAAQFPLPGAIYCPTQGCTADQVMQNGVCVPKPKEPCQDLTFTVNQTATANWSGDYDTPFTATLMVDLGSRLSQIPPDCKPVSYDGTFGFQSAMNLLPNCVSTANVRGAQPGSVNMAPESCTLCGGNGSKYHQGFMNVAPDQSSLAFVNYANHWGDGGGNPSAAAVCNPKITIHTTAK